MPWMLVLNFIKGPYLKYLLILLAVLFVGYKIYSAGQADIQAKWDLDKIRVEKEIAMLKSEAGKVTIQTITKYVDRIQKVKVKGDTITKYVDRIITTESDKNCTIPKNAVLLLDAAASNTELNLTLSTELSTVPDLVGGK